jgi:hypothetical protein
MRYIIKNKFEPSGELDKLVLYVTKTKISFLFSVHPKPVWKLWRKEK